MTKTGTGMRIKRIAGAIVFTLGLTLGLTRALAQTPNPTPGPPPSPPPGGPGGCAVASVGPKDTGLGGPAIIVGTGIAAALLARRKARTRTSD